MRDFFGRLLKTVIIIIVLAAVIVFAVPYAEAKIWRSNAPAAQSNAGHWMKTLDDDLKLNGISIPGTHDSATQYVDIPFFSTCQATSIKEQLEMGYRYLDIRLAVDTDKNGEQKLVFMHGFTPCRTGYFFFDSKLYLEDVLTDIYAFLDENPSETVLFAVKQEYGDESISEFERILLGYIDQNTSKWLLTDEYPKLSEARGKIVLFRRYADEAGLGDEAGISLIWDDQEGRDYEYAYEKSEYNTNTLYVQDHYEYGNGLKWTSFYYGLSNPADSENGEAFINFLSTKGILKFGHAFYHSSVLNKKFKALTLDEATNYGWIPVDFADADMAREIYNTNFTDVLIDY